MFDTLQELKDTYEAARQAIDRTKEPKDYLRRISEYLHALAQDTPTHFQQMSEEHTKFFFEEFCPGLVKRVHRKRSTDDEVSFVTVVPGGDLPALARLLQTCHRVAKEQQTRRTSP